MTNNKKNNWTVDNVVDSVKNTVKSYNEFVYTVAEDIVDGSLKNGTKWQKLATKATKGGLELTAKQQDIAFETISTLKKQWLGGYKKMRKVFA